MQVLFCGVLLTQRGHSLRHVRSQGSLACSRRVHFGLGA